MWIPTDIPPKGPERLMITSILPSFCSSSAIRVGSPPPPVGLPNPTIARSGNKKQIIVKMRENYKSPSVH